MQQTALQFPEVHLFLGNGPDAQYANAATVLASMAPYLEAIQNRIAASYPGQQQPPWLAIWPGNSAVASVQDLGWLMAQIKAKYNCKLMAVISDGSTNNICDYCFTVPPNLMQKFQNGTTVYEGALFSSSGAATLIGGTRFYLSGDFAGNQNQAGILTSLFEVGGGGNQLAEFRVAANAGVPWRYFPAVALNSYVYGSTYGPMSSIMPVLVANNQAEYLSDGTYASMGS